MLAKQAFVEEVKSAATVSQELIEITLEGFGTNKPKPGGEQKADSQESSSSGMVRRAFSLPPGALRGVSNEQGVEFPISLLRSAR